MTDALTFLSLSYGGRLEHVRIDIRNSIRERGRLPVPMDIGALIGPFDWSIMKENLLEYDRSYRGLFQRESERILALTGFMRRMVIWVDPGIDGQAVLLNDYLHFEQYLQDANPNEDWGTMEMMLWTKISPIRHFGAMIDGYRIREEANKLGLKPEGYANRDY